MDFHADDDTGPVTSTAMLEVLGTLLVPVLVAVTPFLWKSVEALTPRQRIARRIEWMQQVHAEMPPGPTREALSTEIDRIVNRYLDLTTDRLKIRPKQAVSPERVLSRRRHERTQYLAAGASIRFALLGALLSVLIAWIAAINAPPPEIEMVSPRVDSSLMDEVRRAVAHCRADPECASPSPSPTSSGQE